MQTDSHTLQIIAKNVRSLRGSRSYAEIARACQTWPATIQRIECAKHMPGAGLLVRIAAALGVSTPDLLKDA